MPKVNKHSWRYVLSYTTSNDPRKVLIRAFRTVPEAREWTWREHARLYNGAADDGIEYATLCLINRYGICKKVDSFCGLAMDDDNDLAEGWNSEVVRRFGDERPTFDALHT